MRKIDLSCTRTYICMRPEETPLERGFMSMEEVQQKQMEKLFLSAYYLVHVEHSFRDFAKLMILQECNGLSFGHTYCNSVQCRNFVHFMADKVRQTMVQKEDFFSVCMDSSTDKAIDEEMVQVRKQLTSIQVNE